jgi:predicted nucleotidyltransferase
MSNRSPTLILSPGTRIVVTNDVMNPKDRVAYPRGAVGVIVKSPLHLTSAYLVRMLDGDEVWLKRDEFAVHKHFQNPQAPKEEFDLYTCVQFRCIVGSRAYGLDMSDSDTDLRGFYLPPAELQWSLYGVPEQLENPDTEEVYWELQKFLTLALKANPNILECLYTPLVELATPIAQELLDMRAIFLSKLIYQTYNGYVMSQFRKLKKHLENHGTIRWKHAMHLIRLLLSGITALNEGYIPVQVDEHRDQLLMVREGYIPWEEVDQWRRSLHKLFDAAFNGTTLPERPDYDQANAFLIRARRNALS